jgi:uncharacterized lipoprotein YbaY
MTYIGHVEHGQVVLDPPIALPEGARVSVSVIADEAKSDQPVKSLLERMQAVVGKVKDMPPDFAINHDHYLHGQPKRQ